MSDATHAADFSARLVACIPSLRRYARALLGDRYVADDLVQDTLDRAWQAAFTWRPEGDMRAWLFAIMHNLYVDERRRARLMIENDEAGAADAPMRPTQTDGLEVRDLDRALDQLPDEQRAVLMLVVLEEMKYEEVAQVLGIPVGTVMSRLSRARERLRVLMNARSQLKLVR